MGVGRSVAAALGTFAVGSVPFGVAAPTLAGVINSAGSFKADSNAELTEVYNNRTVTSAYTDITSGSCGTHSAKSGYDLCTGVGVVKSKKDK
jgi:hypothetical protein